MQLTDLVKWIRLEDTKELSEQTRSCSQSGELAFKSGVLAIYRVVVVRFRVEAMSPIPCGLQGKFQREPMHVGYKYDILDLFKKLEMVRAPCPACPHDISNTFFLSVVLSCLTVVWPSGNVGRSRARSSRHKSGYSREFSFFLIKRFLLLLEKYHAILYSVLMLKNQNNLCTKTVPLPSRRRCFDRGNVIYSQTLKYYVIYILWQELWRLKKLCRLRDRRKIGKYLYFLFPS